MDSGERMTPAELRVVREYLGLSGTALARLLGVADRTVRHWEEGRYLIPDGVRSEVERIEQQTAAFVAAIAGPLAGAPDPAVVTYRNDADYRNAHPGIQLPASWHRAVIARVAEQVQGLTITYTPCG